MKEKNSKTHSFSVAVTDNVLSGSDIECYLVMKDGDEELMPELPFTMQMVDGDFVISKDGEALFVCGADEFDTVMDIEFNSRPKFRYELRSHKVETK